MLPPLSQVWQPIESMFVKSEDTYKRIPQDQISELEKDVKSTAANQTRWHCRACWLLVVSTLSICLLGFMILYDYLQRRSSTEYCLARTTLPSPVTKDVRITYQTTTFDGSFFEENKFRKDGSPEVDEAWASLGVNCKIQMTKQHKSDQTNASCRQPYHRSRERCTESRLAT